MNLILIRPSDIRKWFSFLAITLFTHNHCGLYRWLALTSLKQPRWCTDLVGRELCKVTYFVTTGWFFVNDAKIADDVPATSFSHQTRLIFAWLWSTSSKPLCWCRGLCPWHHVETVYSKAGEHWRSRRGVQVPNICRFFMLCTHRSKRTHEHT